MMSIALPICFFPTKKVILDDNTDYSNGFLLKLHNQQVASYQNPDLAMKYLLNDCEVKLKGADLVVADSEIVDSSTQHIININISGLKNKLVEKIEPEVSVVFVDYHMPEMTGIDFLEKIQHLPIKKVLLTGENDYRIAVDAFNSGLVDAYIRKDDPDFLEKINEVITTLEWKYFSDFSRLVSGTPEFNYLNNPSVVALFKELMQKEGFAGYCMTHVQGDFVMRDLHGRQSCLLLRQKAQLSELAKIAEEDGASNETVNALQGGLMIPYFSEKEYWEVPGCEWDSRLYPAKSLVGDDNLVWALVEV